METLIKTLKTLPVSTATLDASGTIVAVNDAWKDFGRRNGLRIPNSGVGSNYLQYCRGKGLRLTRFKKDLKDLLAGRLDLLTSIYPCHSPNKKRWFCLVGVPFPPARPAGAALLHVNLTDMLPFSMEAHLKQPRTGQGGQIRSEARLEAISGAVERSVSETLSSQLNALLANNVSSARQDTTLRKDQDSTREDALADSEREQILARAQLSKRQMQILRLLGEGKTNKEIADLLFRSPNTVKLHVSTILKRLELKSRTQAALLASRL
jgi:DNA-binding CsgD family transcriptional regulator